MSGWKCRRGHERVAVRYGGGENSKPTNQSQLQRQVEKGQSPKEVDRVDKSHVSGQKPHIHFKDGTSLNIDGTVSGGQASAVKGEFGHKIQTFSRLFPKSDKHGTLLFR